MKRSTTAVGFARGFEARCRSVEVPALNNSTEHYRQSTYRRPVYGVKAEQIDGFLQGWKFADGVFKTNTDPYEPDEVDQLVSNWWKKTRAQIGE